MASVDPGAQVQPHVLLERLVRRATSDGLQACIEPEAAEALLLETEAASSLFDEVQVVYAVCSLAAKLVSIGGSDGVLSEMPVAAAVRDGLQSLAELLAPAPAGSAVLCADTSYFDAHARAALQAVGEDIDLLAAQLFVTLLRVQDAFACVRGASKVQQAAGKEILRHYRAVQGVAIWALELLARLVGYDQVTSRTLWEWTNGDPFCIFILTRDLLSLGTKSSCGAACAPGPGTALDLILGTEHDGTDALPREVWRLQEIIREAVLGLASPDVAFLLGSHQEQTTDNVDITERNRVLDMHRAILAVAAVDCDVVGVLICQLEPGQTHSSGMHCAKAVAFLAILVQLGVSTLAPAREAAQHFIASIARHTSMLWELLRGVLKHVVFNRVGLRLFLKDCVTLSQMIPAQKDDMSRFVKRCLRVQVADSSEPLLLEDAKALALLVTCAANCRLVPCGDGLATVLLGSEPDFISKLVAELNRWREPTNDDDDDDSVDRLVPWLNLVGTNVASAPDVASESSDDDDFFRQARQTTREFQKEAPQVRRRTLDDLSSDSEGEQANVISPPEDEPEPSPPPPPAPPLSSPEVVPESRAPAASAAPGGLRALLPEAPAELRCALDGKLLADPVRSPQGYVFERASLALALAANGERCPLTGEPLSLSACTRDPKIRLKVVQWVRDSRRMQR
eukprot:TRINITY_DN64422_c0_g1_i1.p1 TRINITY_DN64422_c0_g1~~TRINITY_DN64422_c0_g1_i1.p1  ORF type:complete len:682 (+),score=117.93 TRINITY_DN64422_c0_g1_i1:26-2071(+)